MPKRKNKSLSRKIILFSIIAVFLFFFVMISSWTKILIGQLSYRQSGRVISPLERDILRMVRNYPIEKMAPYISQYDRRTAAFIVGVAKKESNWGKSVPKKNGRDCFNYWGYRGSEENITQDGYSCFASRQEAVKTIAGRFEDLIKKSDLDTPEKMIVWKCGWNCDGHSPESVEKWIADVGYYFRKLYEKI